MAANVEIRDSEREFRVEELFFSTTDERGVICSGNEVFVRISGYSQEELMGRPHNIIRHPHMPRCVFKLLWEYIQQGKRIAAYVKNRAKDGSHYWVVAVVFPMEDGYLSVRMKPTSPVFAKVEAVYKELLDIEKRIEGQCGTKKEAMAASTERLMEILDSLGFKTYDDFMHAVVVEECKSRAAHISTMDLWSDQGDVKRRGGATSLVKRLVEAQDLCHRIHQDLDTAFSGLDKYRELNSQLTTISGSMVSVAGKLNFFSLNASVCAARLGEKGRTLGVVAERMAASSSEVGKLIERSREDMASTQKMLGRACFELAVTDLGLSTVRQFVSELLHAETSENAHHSLIRNGARNEKNMVQLAKILVSGVSAASVATRELNFHLDGLKLGIDELSKLIRALDFTHLSGRVEASRLDDSQTFVNIFEEASRLIEETRLELDKLVRGMTAVKLPPIRSLSAIEDISEMFSADRAQ